MLYIINFLLAFLFTYITFGIYPDIMVNTSYSLLLFSFWYTLLWLLSFFYDRKGHFRKVPLVIGLALYYLKELMLASVRVAYDVVTPADYMTPGIIAYPLEAKTDIEITILANFITLTPGSLSIDISDDKSILYIHEMYVENSDIEKKKREIRDGFEKRILKITRP